MKLQPEIFWESHQKKGNQKQTHLFCWKSFESTLFLAERCGIPNWFSRVKIRSLNLKASFGYSAVGPPIATAKSWKVSLFVEKLPSKLPSQKISRLLCFFSDGFVSFWCQFLGEVLRRFPSSWTSCTSHRVTHPWSLTKDIEISSSQNETSLPSIQFGIFKDHVKQ